MAGALLILHLGVIAWFLFGRPRGLDPSAHLSGPAARRARYRRWLARAWCLFALPPFASLVVLGELPALAGYPRAFLPLTAALGGFVPVADLLQGVLIGCAGGIALLATLFRIQRWRGRPAPGTLGDIAALMPETRGELPYGLLLAATAGITEELFFRLSLPLLVMRAGGGVWLGVGLATALFGAVHRYQGWRGVAATTIVGAVFAGLYASAGAIWVAMLAHALMDMVALVIRPILGGALRRR